MILLIDNYDSFSYNLYHCFASYDEVQVARNDEIDIETIKSSIQPSSSSLQDQDDPKTLASASN